jgi:hypothetical protein
MSKKPKLQQEYHAGKDKFKISLHGYSLKSKASRDAILKKIRDEIEKGPTRSGAAAKKPAKKPAGKKPRVARKDNKPIEAGDQKLEPAR